MNKYTYNQLKDQFGKAYADKMAGGRMDRDLTESEVKLKDQEKDKPAKKKKQRYWSRKPKKKKKEKVYVVKKTKLSDFEIAVQMAELLKQADERQDILNLLSTMLED